MTIQEAIRSKKPFRRKSWDNFYICVKFGELVYEQSPLEYHNITVESILAKDWVIKKEKSKGIKN